MSPSVYLDIAECWTESPLVWQVEGRHVRHVFSPQLEVELGQAAADRPDVDDGRPGVVVQQGDVQAGEGREGADQQLQSCCHSCPGHVNLNLHAGRLRGSFRKCMRKEHASNDNMTFTNTFGVNK